MSDIKRNKNKNSWLDMFNFFLEYNTGKKSKGDLMEMAYGKNYSNVDSAIPQSLWETVDNTQFFVYDYNENSFGKLVDLRVKMKYSNAPVDITIVVGDDSESKNILHGKSLPEELQNGLTFHKALAYVFNHDEVTAFDIRPKAQKLENGGVLKPLQQYYVHGKRFYSQDDEKSPKKYTTQSVYAENEKEALETAESIYGKGVIVKTTEFGNGGSADEKDELAKEKLGSLVSGSIEYLRKKGYSVDSNPSENFYENTYKLSKDNKVINSSLSMMDIMKYANIEGETQGEGEEFGNGGKVKFISKYAEIGYRKEAPNTWRFVDLEATKDLGSPSVIGGIYKTEKELLMNVESFATERGFQFAKGGGVDDITYKKVFEILKDKIETAVEDVDFENKNDNSGVEVEHKSVSGFIPFTNGGFELSWYEGFDNLSGSGKKLPTAPLDKEMQRQVDYGYELAKDKFKETYPDIVAELGEDNIDYNTLYENEYGSEAEELSSWESDNNDGQARMKIFAYYYNPTNDKGEDGKHTISLQADVNLESPYHREGNLDDFKEIIFTFDSISDLEKKMDENLKALVAWFNRSEYNDSTREMKVRKMKNGGGVETTWGGVRGALKEPMLSFKKVDYHVNVNPENFEVDVNIDENDSVDHLALNDTDAKWNQERWGYMVYPKSVEQLYKVLKALKVRVGKERLERYFKGQPYATGGDVKVEAPFGIYGSNGMYYITDRAKNTTLPTFTVSHWTSKANEFKSKKEAVSARHEMMLKMHKEEPAYNLHPDKYKFEDGGGVKGTVKTKDGVTVTKGSSEYKGHIFYDEKGVGYECLGYFPKLDDCMYKNLETGNEVVGCMDGFYFENPVGDKFAKGGEVEFKENDSFKNSNLYFVGYGHDVNGNHVVRVTFPNKRAFAIQTLGDLPHANRLMRGIKKLAELEADQIELIEREITEYVKNYGSDNQKKSLKIYEKLASGGEVRGRGWGDFEKGKKITDIKEFKVGEMYLQYSEQFNAKNIIVIVSGDKTELNRPIVYASYLRPNDLTKKEEHFAIWDYDLDTNGGFYNIKGKEEEGEELKVIIKGKGEIYEGKSMKKARELFDAYTEANPEKEVSIVNENEETIVEFVDGHERVGTLFMKLGGEFMPQKLSIERMKKLVGKQPDYPYQEYKEHVYFKKHFSNFYFLITE